MTQDHELATPPRARRSPVERVVHGALLVDDYAWLRERDDPAVIAHLEAENSWTERELSTGAALRDRLYAEIVGRIQESDSSAPVRDGAWWYYVRTEEGRQYGILCRRPVAPGDDLGPAAGAGEQVLLDANVEAERLGGGYFSLGVRAVSPDHRLLAWSYDVDGDETYTLRFRDLATGEELPDEIAGVGGGGAWATDNRTWFSSRLDAAKRPFQIWRHALGTPASADARIFTEPDELFRIGVYRTRDDRLVVIAVSSSETGEAWLLDADRPTDEPRLVAARRPGVQYDVDHHDGRLLIHTNADGATNFALYEAPIADPGPGSWRPLIAHRPDVRLDGVDVFRDHLLLSERADGLTRLRVHRLADSAEHEIAQPEPVATVGSAGNPEFAPADLRYAYTSLATPGSVFAYDPETRVRRLVKRDPVLGGYDPAEYVTDRWWATAPDGVRVPMSYVRRRDVTPGPATPTLLYGYGSYEISIDPAFSPARIGLLDRGVQFVVAHVRGGGEMGRSWYEAARYLTKRTTFSDFIACARHLIDAGLTSPPQLAIRGGSAGGLLVGAVLNLAPELFGAAVADVPFVDALNTMLDPTLPLTVGEYEEWGNPTESAEHFAYIRSYAPYENVRAVDYPPLLVTAGLNDPRVAYWEPAKWVAKLRTTKTDANPLLLLTEMGAGHGGPSGRYERFRREALVQAFILTALGIEPGQA